MTVFRATYFDPDDDERRAIADLDPRHAELSPIVGGLPPTVDRAVRPLLEDFAAGASIHLVPTDAELTTQQAADTLGFSRTCLVWLIDQGIGPAHLAGTHRRPFRLEPPPMCAPPNGRRPGVSRRARV